MRPIILSVIALLGAALFADTAEAQLLGRFRRQPDINIQVNNGVGGQQFRQQQQFRGHVQQFRQQQNFHYQKQFRQQTFYVPAQQAVTYVQPVVAYVQPQAVVVEKQYFQQQQSQCYGCQGGGLQLNQGCASLFAH